MFDHVMLNVSNYEASKAFYVAALAPLGARIIKEVAEAKACGFGTRFPVFWIAEGPVAQTGRAHVAFAACSRANVHKFHAAALAAGGKENGAPGFRPQYHPYYYGAFILDPDGYNIEAVKHMPEGLSEYLRMVWAVLSGLLSSLLGGSKAASSKPKLE